MSIQYTAKQKTNIMKNVHFLTTGGGGSAKSTGGKKTAAKKTVAKKAPAKKVATPAKKSRVRK